jgi:hypothetical protein
VDNDFDQAIERLGNYPLDIDVYMDEPIAVFLEGRRNIKEYIALNGFLSKDVDGRYAEFIRQRYAQKMDLSDALRSAENDVRFRASARALNRDHSDTYNKDLERALDIFIDLYTLQERIAGRSPAFEGIRLVKERVR